MPESSPASGAALFYLIQFRIRGADQLRVGHAFRPLGASDAQLQGVGRARFGIEPVQGLPDPLAQVVHFPLPELRGDDEFVPAVAGDEGAPPAAGAGQLQGIGDPHEGGVSLQMPVGIIDLLEKIQVHHQQTEVVRVGAELVGKIPVEVLPVVDLGQLVQRDLLVRGAHIDAQELERDADADDGHPLSDEGQDPGGQQAERERTHQPPVSQTDRVGLPAGRAEDAQRFKDRTAREKEHQDMEMRTPDIGPLRTDPEKQVAAKIRQDEQDRDRQRQKQVFRFGRVLEGGVPHIGLCIPAPAVDAQRERQKIAGFKKIGGKETLSLRQDAPVEEREQKIGKIIAQIAAQDQPEPAPGCGIRIQAPGPEQDQAQQYEAEQIDLCVKNGCQHAPDPLSSEQTRSERQCLRTLYLNRQEKDSRVSAVMDMPGSKTRQ